MKTIIIGGGLTGLSAAYTLSKSGEKIILIEKSNQLGGLASSWNIDGHHIEKYYHHISQNDTFFINLLKELGLYTQLEWKNASTGYHYNGKIYKMDTPLDILKFKGLSLLDTLKLGLLMMNIKSLTNYIEMDKISAKEYLISTVGLNAYTNFFEPLLKSKFGENSDNISAAWLCGRIKFRSGRSLSGEKLGYMKNGFQEFIDKLKTEILLHGGEIMTGTYGWKLDKLNDGTFNVNLPCGQISAEKVISTIAPQSLLFLYPFTVPYKVYPFTSECRMSLSNIKYQGAICALLELDEKLMDEIYWLNIKHPDLPFGAIIEHTNFHKIQDRTFVYVASYNQGLLDQSDEEVISEFVQGIQKIFPNFRRGSILQWKVAKDTYASPVYETGYLENLRGLVSNVKNLYVTGMMRSYPERTMDDSLRLGEEVAREVVRCK